MTLKSFVRTEWIIETWIPVLFIFAMLCLIPVISYFLYEGRSKFMDNKWFKGLGLIVVGALVSVAILAITNLERHNEWQKHINPGIRDRKRIFVNYVMYEDDITGEYERTFYIADDLEALPMYDKIPALSHGFTYLGFADKGDEGSYYYFDNGDFIFTISSPSRIIELEPELDAPYLEGNFYYLNDLAWQEIGFYPTRGYYATVLHMPADAKEKEFEGDTELNYRDINISLKGWKFR